MKLGFIGIVAVMSCGAALCYMAERSSVKSSGAITCVETPVGRVCGQGSASSDIGDKVADQAKKITK